MIILNFTHPITDAQRQQIEQLAGRAIEQITSIPTHLDQSRPLAEQAATLVDQAGLSPEEWQTLPIVINPPGLAPLALAVVAEIHGRRGGFPVILRMRPIITTVDTTYEVAEIVNLQQIREAARERREQ
ncbi:MAG: hypothetical protein KatS3mg057_1149 [Herpetosiphonaceae bacterium]|nr:MAG: hypothetical protein KatS3mg057_1149 [Herpetosiphonaceae bacterium]